MKRQAPALLIGLAAIVIGESVLKSQTITARPMQPLSARVLRVCEEGADEHSFPILRDIGSGFAGGARENDLSVVGARGLKLMAGGESSVVGTREEVEDVAGNLEIHNDRSDVVRVEVRRCSPERPVMEFELPGGTYYSTILEPGAYSLSVQSRHDGWTIRVVLRSKQEGHEYHVRYHRTGNRIPSSNVSKSSSNAGAGEGRNPDTERSLNRIPAPASPSTKPTNISGDVGRARTGDHASLPAATVKPVPEESNARLVVANRSGYPMEVLVLGRTEDRMSLDDDKTGSLSLPAGRYEIVAILQTPGVKPFYGTVDWVGGREYLFDLNYFERR